MLKPQRSHCQAHAYLKLTILHTGVDYRDCVNEGVGTKRERRRCRGTDLVCARCEDVRGHVVLTLVFVPAASAYRLWLQLLLQMQRVCVGGIALFIAPCHYSLKHTRKLGVAVAS